jgi:DNA-binding FadR family transcriptional regulator
MAKQRTRGYELKDPTRDPEQATTLLRGAVPAANVFEATVERIGHSIKIGLFGPGDRLPTERELAEIIGVSRTTVRSAIRVLASGGFLTVKRGRGGGTFVAERLPQRGDRARDTLAATDPDELQQLLDQRRVLECGAAELAAERASSDRYAWLRQLVGRMVEHVDDLDAYRRVDAQFHIAIAQCTGNATLTSAVADLQARLSDLIALIPRSEDALRNSNDQHARIVAAIVRRDGEAARSAMKEHVEATSRFLRGILPRAK